MDGVRTPVGEMPSDVYWRRRLVVLAVAVLSVVVLWYLLRPLFGGPAEPGTPLADTTTSPAPTGSPGVTTPPVISVACAAPDTVIVLAANPQNLAADATAAYFDATVTNNGAAPCLFDTAVAGTEFLVTSGEDRVFSSLDCPAVNPVPATQLLLQPGTSGVFTTAWNLTRSDAACPAAPITVDKTGRYNAALTVNGIVATPASVYFP